MAYQGACVCGSWRFDYEPSLPRRWIERIQCPCKYCVSTSAWLVKDADGEVHGAGKVPFRLYRPTDSSDAHMICVGCGSFLGTVWDDGGEGPRVALNGRLMTTAPNLSRRLMTLRVHDEAQSRETVPSDFPKLFLR